ncbi:hypothetical protein EDB85DRAFT_1897002 [Lactarius pseudohatsudake]|nr:hypothetical protein EDB85DRAFT_1897002 [Lactarius pseudohatsudake]
MVNDWITQAIARPISDMIHALNTHWFFLCCGALVNVPTSLDGVRSFANEWKPANLFAFDAPAFHPIHPATFLLNSFQHIFIEGRSFDSSREAAVKDCRLRWAQWRTRPWGNAVPHQCKAYGCIQAWDQKNKIVAVERRVHALIVDHKDHARDASFSTGQKLRSRPSVPGKYNLRLAQILDNRYINSITLRE